MKLFVAEKSKQGYVTDTDYHWCINGEILMFGQFQTEDNRKGNEVSMCGITSRRFTTRILVKDLDISKEFILELISDSIEKSMCCKINRDGRYLIDLGEGWDMKFNINDILTELLIKADKFEDGDKVVCRGRKLTRI